MKRFGKPASWIGLALLVLTCLTFMALPQRATAITPYVVARFAPAAGSITDAAMLDGRIVLLYPQSGHMAEYSTAGKLTRHIMREAGREKDFRPMFCMAGGDGGLLVFDEAEHKLFAVEPDGNFSSGIDFAYPVGGSAIALSRIGGLAYSGEGDISALLADKDMLAWFDWDGKLTGQLDLTKELPYKNARYVRPQLLNDGSLFVLEYHQGAVVYRRGSTDKFRRIRLETPDGLSAAPVIQDFAVDNTGNVLVVTADSAPRVQVLTPGSGGYKASTLKLDLPLEVARYSCRYSKGKFILWARDTPLVVVLELR